VEYCNWLSRKVGLRPAYSGSGYSLSCDWSADGYRLPTEAEWEYAAKGGSRDRGYKFSGGNDPGTVGWYGSNSGGRTQPVGGKQGNELGLYDMSGNVWEWCWDWYGGYSSVVQTDPRGPSFGNGHGFRGGSWYSDAGNVRAAYRNSSQADFRFYNLGFRLARSRPANSQAQSTPPAAAVKQQPEAQPAPTARPAPEGMVWVEGGTFRMGDTFGDGNSNEKPVHNVTVSGFSIGKYEVTFDEYDAFCADTGKSRQDDQGWGRGRQPAINVSWNDAVEYCNWLSRKEDLRPVYTRSGNSVSCDWNADGYRLPTEAEWEYAAKGGSRSGGYKYSGENDPGTVGWYDSNSGGRTQPVGGKQGNEAGLYDMTGNVWEWCWDYWNETYSSASQKDPRGPSQNSGRVNRGGSWYNDARFVRSTIRKFIGPDYKSFNLGFRLARSR